VHLRRHHADGRLLGFEGLNLPALESGIAASVLALGLAVALAVRPPLSVAVAATALFALFHGVAHGLELPDMSSPGTYAAGFVVATAALHAAGYAVVRVLPRQQHRWCDWRVRLRRRRGVVAGRLILIACDGLFASKLPPTLKCLPLWSELARESGLTDNTPLRPANMSRNRPCRDDASQCRMLPAPPPSLN
jgi:hypothetical protein